MQIWKMCGPFVQKYHQKSTQQAQRETLIRMTLNSTETFKTPSFVWKVLLANTLDNYYFSMLLVWTHWQHIDCQWWSSQPSREKYSLKLCVFLLCSGHAFDFESTCCQSQLLRAVPWFGSLGTLKPPSPCDVSRTFQRLLLRMYVSSYPYDCCHQWWKPAGCDLLHFTIVHYCAKLVPSLKPLAGKHVNYMWPLSTDTY